MRTLKIIAVILSSAFMLNCGVESSPSSSSSDPATSVDELDLRLPTCEGRDGQRCTKKGPAGACDNGTPEGGVCFCAQHGAGPFILVCG